MKNIIFLLALLLTLSNVKAQKKQNVYFFTNKGKEVSSKDSADFMRVIQEPDSGETHFALLDFYKSGKRKTIGKVSSFEPNLVPEGTVIEFSETGRRISVVNYERGMPVGMSYRYFNNGTMHRQMEHIKNPMGFAIMRNLGSELNNLASNYGDKLIYLADSLGSVYVKDGNGHVKENSQVGDNIVSYEGDYKDGLKDGVWKGQETANNLSYVETYSMGKFIMGESISNGKKYTYTQNFEPPMFKGGKEAWANYVGRALTYPKDAFQRGIFGQVQTTFVVDKDGSVTDVNITHGVYPSLDEEAKRVLSNSPKWLPAKARGVPVKVKHNQSINFRIQ